MGLQWNLILPVLGALAAGCLVGYEREYRSRAAGFRTHALVALSSAMLMLAAQHQVDWADSTTPQELMRIDPARMAHGILTGIGFLCGGVIFREGASVHGLTTAASLWITSALGILYGVGFYDLAVGGTVLTLVVLTSFRLINRQVGGFFFSDLTVRYRRDGAPDRLQVCDLLQGVHVRPKRMASRLSGSGDFIEYAMVVVTKNRRDADLDKLTEMLRSDPRVVEYALEPRNT